MDALATSSRVIRPDHRGIGDSLPLSGELTVASMARDVLDLMDSISVGEADVLGWSMGGFIAQQLAADVPHRVRRLVLLATDMGGPQAELADAETWSHLIDYSGTPTEQAARLLRENSQRLSAALPGSRLGTFEGCGHAFMAQEPARLAALIEEWVRRS